MGGRVIHGEGEGERGGSSIVDCFLHAVHLGPGQLL